MKAKTVKVGGYDVIALLYEEGDNSPFDVLYYAKSSVMDFMYLQEGNKVDFENFDEEYAKNLLDMFSDSVDFKSNTFSELYKTDNRMYFMNGEEEIEDNGEVMY